MQNESDELALESSTNNDSPVAVRQSTWLSDDHERLYPVFVVLVVALLVSGLPAFGEWIRWRVYEEFPYFYSVELIGHSTQFALFVLLAMWFALGPMSRKHRLPICLFLAGVVALPLSCLSSWHHFDPSDYAITVGIWLGLASPLLLTKIMIPLRVRHRDEIRTPPLSRVYSLRSLFVLLTVIALVLAIGREIVVRLEVKVSDAWQFAQILRWQIAWYGLIAWCLLGRLINRCRAWQYFVAAAMGQVAFLLSYDEALFNINNLSHLFYLVTGTFVSCLWSFVFGEMLRRRGYRLRIG